MLRSILSTTLIGIGLLLLWMLAVVVPDLRLAYTWIWWQPLLFSFYGSAFLLGGFLLKKNKPHMYNLWNENMYSFNVKEQNGRKGLKKASKHKVRMVIIFALFTGATLFVYVTSIIYMVFDVNSLFYLLIPVCSIGAAIFYLILSGERWGVLIRIVFPFAVGAISYALYSLQVQ